MAQMAEKDMNTVSRRVASMAQHFIPVHLNPNESGSLGLCNTSNINDSYHRVHGEVPSHPAVWRNARDDSGKEYQFTDVIYEKAVGEAIAKVSLANTLY